MACCWGKCIFDILSLIFCAAFVDDIWWFLLLPLDVFLSLGVDWYDGVSLGKNLQAQYERWQPRAKYKTHLDPTVDDVKKLAISCRKSARVRVGSFCSLRCCLCTCQRAANTLFVQPSKYAPTTV